MAGEGSFIVFRQAASLSKPDAWMSLDGLWLDVGAVLGEYDVQIEEFEFGGVRAVPTDRWEFRDDGRVAQVYEFAAMGSVRARRGLRSI